MSSALKLLVTGGSGQVGAALVALATAQGFTIDAPGRTALDLSSARSIVEYPLASIAAIINCAAYTAVDKAESEQERARAINSTAPALLGTRAAAANIPILHVSTDYVFDGSKRGAYTEDDAPNPLSVYGASKRGGEAGIMASGARYGILRTAWVVSAAGTNFINTMLRLGVERDALSVVDDQHGCPTNADDIAAALLTMTTAFIENNQRSGLWHFVNSEQTTWHGLAAHVFKRAKAVGLKVPQLHAIPTSAYPTPAKRPANSVLNTARFVRDFGVVPRAWEAAIDDILAVRLPGLSAV